MPGISLKKLSNFWKSLNISWTFTKMALDQNPVSETAFLLNLCGIKACRSYSHILLFLRVCLYERELNKAELHSAYHKEWYLKFCPEKNQFFFFFFWLFHFSLHGLHKVYNVTSCCLYTQIVMTTVRDSWLWLAAQERKSDKGAEDEDLKSITQENGDGNHTTIHPLVVSLLQFNIVIFIFLKWVQHDKFTKFLMTPQV